MSRISTIRSDGQWYKGNTHTHTTVSDGTWTPQAMAQAYEQKGYDFLAITDHRIYGVYPEMNRDDFIILPGVELDVKVPGNEALCHHVVGIGLPGESTFKHGQAITYPDNTNVRQLTAYLRANGNVCIYAHPNWSHLFQEELCDVPGLIGMEIFNYSCEVSVASGYADAWYDRLLWAGKKIWCIASDDAHLHRPDLGGSYIQVKAEQLTHQAIMESVLSGSFYASEGPSIESFYVEEGQVHITCSPCRKVGFLTDSHPGFSVNDESGNLTEATVSLKGSEHYIRAICIDASGKKAWAQPISL
jgi:hypothetical protein